MNLVIMSDIHGNLPALQEVINANHDTDGYICLGDVVNYGPWSNECVDVISSLPNCIYIRGNHEEYFIDGSYPGDNEVAKTFFEFCYPSFNNVEKIRNLRESYTLNGFTFSHTIQNQYVYPDSEIVLDNNYVVGHSHHQFIIDQPPYRLYNPGSVGQNRKHINVINYLTLDTETMTFTPHAITYDADSVINKMRELNYPQLCIDYYNNKERL
ncbi:MAG: metallophosphoesterase family protein [Candidatus Microsaccharimonas sp.]